MDKQRVGREVPAYDEVPISFGRPWHIEERVEKKDVSWPKLAETVTPFWRRRLHARFHGFMPLALPTSATPRPKACATAVLVECVEESCVRTTAQSSRGPSSLFDGDGLSFRLLA
jgi:hypothetical protein